MLICFVYVCTNCHLIVFLEIYINRYTPCVLYDRRDCLGQLFPCTFAILQDLFNYLLFCCFQLLNWVRLFCDCIDCCLGEENGHPLLYSCLENPVDRGAWWAAVHSVAQRRLCSSDSAAAAAAADYCLPRSSVHEISQARILEWVAISFSRGIFPTQGSNLMSLALAGEFFTTEPQGKPQQS